MLYARRVAVSLVAFTRSLWVAMPRECRTHAAGGTSGRPFFPCLGLNCCQVVPCASFRVKQRAENEAQQRRKVKTGSDKLSINISAEIRANIPPQFPIDTRASCPANCCITVYCCCLLISRLVSLRVKRCFSPYWILNLTSGEKNCSNLLARTEDSSFFCEMTHLCTIVWRYITLFAAKA